MIFKDFSGVCMKNNSVQATPMWTSLKRRLNVENLKTMEGLASSTSLAAHIFMFVLFRTIIKFDALFAHSVKPRKID